MSLKVEKRAWSWKGTWGTWARKWGREVAPDFDFRFTRI